MLDVLVVVAFLGLVAFIAIRSFLSPHGVYLRSVLTLAGVVASALALWGFAGPTIAAEAGFGAFVVVTSISAIGFIVTAVACLSASLGHLVNVFSRDASSPAHESAFSVRPTAFKTGVGDDAGLDIPGFGLAGAALRPRASRGGAEHAL